ncbi:hypothetical protein D9757_000503 [Collybiopsis confluens]|uniref:Uncharacterized protein n=1 Tax=Collybiopsis confluens TaxID=2823264 RepID=A0A8H5I1F0_9AGAR|nr:hypothetical protein D9757_000503 [Collybiopsis confluens]
MTFTTITTVSTKSRPRRFSLSLVSAKPSPLLNLPAELVIDILELVFAQTKPSVLSTISKAISLLVDIVLYRTVVLHSKESLVLFHRTTLSRSPAFFDSHVKKLVVSYKPQNVVTYERAQRAISVCTGVRSLVLSMWFGAACLTSIMGQRADGGVSEITLQSTDGIQTGPHSSKPSSDLQLADSASDCISHLRIAEPGEGWTSPEEILRPFGALRNLTHLQLSRRVNSNVENDIKFENQVRSILRTRPTKLSTVAVVIFPQSWAQDDDVEESDIWDTMNRVAELDQRLVLAQGKVEDWGKQWRHADSVTGRGFWKEIRGDVPKRKI